MSDIKLSMIVQERFKILLNNIGFWFSIFMEFFVSHKSLDLHCCSNTDAISTVCVLSWFYDPYTLFFLQLFLLEFFDP